MQQFIANIIRQLNDFWEKTERRDRIRFLVIGIVAVAVIVTSVLFLTRKEYTAIVTNLDPAQAGEVLGTLTGMGVDARPEGTGTILVPADQADELRMQLAAQGLPNKTGMFNYDVFGQGTGFGTTQFEKQQYELFQKQERIASTIMLNDGIKQAVVTIAKPGNEDSFIFRSDVVPTQASVMLYMEGDATLSQEQIEAIEYLVATSVDGLSTENISITDNYFRRLNHRESLDFSTLQTNLEYQNAYRDELTLRLRSLLDPIFGSNRVRIGVDVILDFDEKTAQRITFTPVNEEEIRGIEVSMAETVEKLTGGGTVANVPGIDPNGAAPEYPELTTDSTGTYSRTVREVNYEINQLNEMIESAQGQVKTLTVAVGIDNKDLPGDSATADQIASIVAGAMGLVSEEDRENIVVQFLPFNGTIDTTEIDEYLRQQQEQERLFELIRTIVLYAIIAICLILLIITTANIMKKGRLADSAAQLALAQFDNLEEDVEVDEYGNLIRLATGEKPANIAEAEKTQERVLIEEFIEKKPDAAAELLRNWLNDEKEGRQGWR